MSDTTNDEGLPESWRKELSTIASFCRKTSGNYFDERDEGMVIKLAQRMRAQTDQLPSHQIVQYLVRHGCDYGNAEKHFLDVLEQAWR